MNAIVRRSNDAMLAASESGQCKAEDMLLQFIAANPDSGGDGCWFLTILPDGAKYLAEQLRGLPRDPVRLRAPISQSR